MYVYVLRVYGVCMCICVFVYMQLCEVFACVSVCQWCMCGGVYHVWCVYIVYEYYLLAFVHACIYNVKKSDADNFSSKLSFNHFPYAERAGKQLLLAAAAFEYKGKMELRAWSISIKFVLCLLSSLLLLVGLFLLFKLEISINTQTTFFHECVIHCIYYIANSENLIEVKIPI